MYNVKDNVESKLQFGISSITTSLIVEEGSGSLFPEAPFIAVLNRRNEDGNIIKSEKIEITAIDGDQFTITRGFDKSEASDFNAGDYISLFVMAKHIQELQEGLSEIQKDISEEGLVKPATENTSGTIKIATKDTINNVVVKDANGVFYVPTVSDLIPEYIGSTFISGSDIATTNDTYVHDAPNPSECTQEFYIGKESSNQILDIQGLSNGRGFDSITLKLDKGGLPTTKLVVEVMSAAVNGNFWTGDEVLATGELSADSITEPGIYSIPLDSLVSLTLGTPFVLRIRQTHYIVNEMNYFIVYGHPTRSSDIFSGNYVKLERESEESSKMIVSSLTNTIYDIYFSCYGKLTQAIKQRSNGKRTFDSQYLKRSAEVVASGFSYPFNLSSPDIDPESPISISGTIQFVQHSNNGATLYSSSDAQGWMRYLGVDSNKVRDISANGRTYTINLNNKSVTLSDLANGVIEIVGQASLSTRDHRWSECYFTITWNLVLSFTDLNSGGEVQAVYLRNNAKRLGLVSATLVGKHIDGSFIYPKNDGSHAVIAGQRGEDGKKIQLKVEDKCFYYKYEGDVNRTKLSDFYDFIGPVGATGPQGIRGPMGGINYRGKLNSISELPEEGSIEGEAYSLSGILYIRNGEYFLNSGIPLSSINISTDWENITNKPDYLKLSDEVALQISENNYDFLRRITEGLYKQLNLLDTNLGLTSGENIIEVADNWIGKILVNNYFYNEYVANSTYALNYINKNNQNYMFQLTSGLHNQISFIDWSLGITSGEDMEEVANTWYGKLISNNNFYTNHIAKSSYALGFINRNNTDYLFQLDDLFYRQLNYIDNNLGFTDGDSFSEMLELPSEMAKFWSSSLMRDSYFAKSTYAINTYKNLSENLVVPIILACLEENSSSVSTLSALMSNGNLMVKLANSPFALYAVLNNSLAVAAMCNSSVAMNNIKASSIGMNILANHSYAMGIVWDTVTSRTALLGSTNAMGIVMDSSTGSTSLANSTASLTALSNSLTYLTIVLKNQANMKEGLFDALQPYSYKIYTTLNNSLDAERYYSSDRDRSECGTKLSFTNTYYSFGNTAIIFPAYYWDDSDSRSQQMKSERFNKLIGYMHSSYANATSIDIIASSSDAKPMGFGLKGCMHTNVGGSNYGLGVEVFTV